MKRTIILGLGMLLAMSSLASAEFLTLEATKIVTIEPADKSESPRILVQWTLPKDLDEKIIDAVAIEMHIPVSAGDRVAVDVAAVEKEWASGTASWASGWEKDGGDFSLDESGVAIVTEKNQGTIRVDVREAVLSQIAGSKSNYGFVIVPKGADNRLKSIAADDETQLGKCKLIIAYRNRR